MSGLDKGGKLCNPEFKGGNGIREARNGGISFI